MTKVNRKSSIWLSDPLLKLKENLPEGKKFSGRLADITERYDAIIKNTELPTLEQVEIDILSEVLLGSYLTPTKLKYLHEEILDAGTGTDEEKKNLSEKVKNWSPAEIVKFLEECGV